ncbi:MAG: LacI family DNA-binding transcriptional regulator [Saprospiraceae bacterium]|nr:LacI family DNA-binding transcriptional regulator [Saprospiraceae bacterium]
MAKTRIKDIALAAGVSVGTVDRVIHNRGRVAKEAEEKVKKAIELLNYKPNLAARSLARQTVHKIAIVLPSQEEDEFWMAQRHGIRRALDATKDFGLSAEIITFDDQKKGELLKLSARLFEGGYDALLIAPNIKGEARTLLDQCNKLNMPYVQINSNIDHKGANSLGFVGQDSYRSGQLAGKLLDIALGAPVTIGILHMETEVEEGSHLLAKEAGLKDYFKKHGDPRIVVTQIVDISHKSVIRSVIEELLHDYPDLMGLFVTTSRIHHIAEILKDLDKMEISLVGFDLVQKNIDALGFYKRLFLINQNPSLQGYYGVMRLFDHFLKHKTIRSTKYLPLGIITLENVSNYLHIQDRDNILQDNRTYG